MISAKETRGRAQLLGFSAVLLMLLVAGTLFAAQFRAVDAPFDIGDYSSVVIADAEKAFQSGGSNEQLILLLKGLCYRQEALGEAGWAAKLAAYGRELYSRAKAGTVDLETVDEENVMRQVLKVLRESGADR